MILLRQLAERWCIELASKSTSTVSKIIMKKTIPVLVIIILILTAVVVQKLNENRKIASHPYKQEINYPEANAGQYSNTLMAENEIYELYLDGPTLSITLKDKKTGAVLKSSVGKDDDKINDQWQGFMKSGIVLDVIDGKGKNDQLQADFINDDTSIAIEKIENGFHAYVSFSKYEFYFQVYVTLEGDSLNVEIPDHLIIENCTKYTTDDPNKEYYIGAINVFPFLGSTHLGDTPGYMLLPDGNGSLIYLNDKEGKVTGGFSRMFYGEDIGFKESEVVSLLWGMYYTVNQEESLMAPIFGMVHTEDKLGFLGIIEGGAERASLEAYPNGVKVNYNRIYPKFILRKVYVQPTSQSNSGTVKEVEEDRSHSDIKVQYCLVDGDSADYSGLANRYRDYLLQDSGLSVKDNSYNTRVDFLGTERENGLLTKKTVTMTSTDDIRDIYKDLETAGVTDLLSIYKGWQAGGLYKVPVKSYTADSAIGGTKELTKLINEANESGKQFFLYQDALRINPDIYNATFNVVKRVNKRLYEEWDYQQVYERFLYLTPSRSDYFIDRLTKDYLKKGIEDISLAGISNHIYSYSYSGKYYSRNDTMTQYVNTISGMDQDFDLVLTQPNYYLWNYTDAFLDMPVSSSTYNYEDEDIPFLSMVLKGVMPMYSEYMNFEAKEQEFILKLIESGVYPSFYITQEDSSKLIYTNSAQIFSSQYTAYKDDIIQYNEEFKQINEAVKDAFIKKHERLDNGVTVVNYNNGINIYINYSNTDQTVDGYLIEAMRYKVGEAK
jgi:hypothetical protein